MTSPASGPSGAPATLSRELADFLVELSIALHKNAIYPPGHPLLRNTVSGVTRKLAVLLQERNALSIGIARHQLIIEGVATDSGHPLLRELAQRLHRHHLGAIRFSQGITPEELEDVLNIVARSGGRDETPLGLGPADLLQQWQHSRLYALTYDQLQLLDDEPPPAGAEDQPAARGGRGAQLWVGLARAALAADAEQGTAASEQPEPDLDPVIVARAIDDRERDQAYDQVIVGYLLQIAEELKTRRGAESVALQKRISTLVGSMRPQTLQRLLEMGGDAGQRRRFVLDAAQGMAVDAVMDVVRAAAENSHQTISNSLMRLLSKLATHAESGTPEARDHADVQLRDHVRRLITEWDLTDPNPDAYRAVLDRMARANPVILGSSLSTNPCEPERVLAMSLEVGFIGDTAIEAADDMAARGRLPELLDLLDRAPPNGGLTDVIWQRVLASRPVRTALELADPDPSLLARLIRREGLAAAEPLLDALESEHEPLPAATLVDLLASLGPDVVSLAVRRLPLVRWNVQRHILAILGRVGHVPADLPLEEYARHADARVRREALRLYFLQPNRREAGVMLAIADSDEAIMRSGFAAAAESYSPRVVAAIGARALDTELDPVLRALAIRALAGCGSGEGRDTLIHLVMAPRKRFRRRGLASKSPELLAALTALAQRWGGDPRAAPVLQLAARHKDPDIRAAAAVRRERA